MRSVDNTAAGQMLDPRFSPDSGTLADSGGMGSSEPINALAREFENYNADYARAVAERNDAGDSLTKPGLFGTDASNAKSPLVSDEAASLFGDQGSGCGSGAPSVVERETFDFESAPGVMTRRTVFTDESVRDTPLF